jgi:hypothetical protein
MVRLKSQSEAQRELGHTLSLKVLDYVLGLKYDARAHCVLGVCAALELKWCT